MQTHDTPFRYDPRHLFAQWDPETKRMSYRHPTPKATHRHGPESTFMGWTTAGAREMCHLENAALEEAARRQGVRDAFAGRCVDAVLARQRQTLVRRQAAKKRGDAAGRGEED